MSARPPSPPPVARSARGPTYRISGVPATVTTDTFRSYIGSLAEGHEITLSLAPYGDGYKTATVTFEELVPPPPPPFAACTPGKRLYPVAEGIGRLVLDCDFFGITPLHCAEDGAEVDIIAVTGLAGHAYGSWRSRTLNRMWLRDFLPPDLEARGHRVRILTYGYDCGLRNSTSTGGIDDFAKGLLLHVNGVRMGGKERHRPIIFVAHSLGGLVVKQALADARFGGANDQAILHAVTGLFFFGVPNCGLDVTNLLTLVRGANNARLVDDLGVGSHLLAETCRHFARGFKHEDCQITSFYELRDTEAVVVQPNGTWTRGGPMIRLVTPESATYGLPSGPMCQQIPIDADHSNMVKFSDVWDRYYMIVRDALAECVRGSPAIVRARWRAQGSAVVPGYEDAEAAQEAQSPTWWFDAAGMFGWN